MTEQEIKELKVAGYKCKTSQLFFTRYFFKKRFGRKFVIGDHHTAISDALDRVIDGKTKRLIINIAPRYGKTELAVKNFIARGLAINPCARFMHLSYSDDLALDNSDEVRDMVKMDEYGQLFNVKVSPKTDSKKKWYTTSGGGVYATSMAGQVTGFGAGAVDREGDDVDELPDDMFVGQDGQLFAGAIIIDDPIKPEDADSDTVRDRINNRYTSTIKNRVNSRNTPIIIIMQRLHEQDLCGYLLEQEPGEWEVLSLPSIVDYGTEQERALWEFKHTLDELKIMEKREPIVFHRQHMQKPKPLEGLLFPQEKLRYFKPDNSRIFESSIGYADIADEGEDSLSAPIGRNIGNDIYITDVVFNSQDNTDVTCPAVAKMCKDADTRYIRVESNSMGAMFGRNLSKIVPTTCTVLQAHSTTNKHTRILNDCSFIREHCLFVHPDHQTDEYRLFMKELTSYLKNGKSKHDDAPDSISGLVIFIRSMLPHLYA